MKIDKNSEQHLTYCSNIHTGESWQAVFANLKQYIPDLKQSILPNEPFGIGLRLSNQAASELLANENIFKFKNWLADNQLYVFTINGFAYGAFHQQRIKDKMYQPDWLKQERQHYNLKLLKILDHLTPSGDESGFSTSPISYKPWLINSYQSDQAFYHASIYLSQIVAEMIRIYKCSGKVIHIDIEAEPDCLIETADESIKFYNKWLIPTAVPYLSSLLNITPEVAETYIRNHVRLCYDICHSSVEFEDPVDVFKKFSDAHILIGKVQISSALKVTLDDNAESRRAIFEYLSKFFDRTYLHQVVEHYTDGTLHHFPDLNLIAKHYNQYKINELRTHFHVPVFIENYQMLQSTQNDVITVLKLIRNDPSIHHLEIETYTWDVLPAELKLDLKSSIQREYDWVLHQLHL